MYVCVSHIDMLSIKIITAVCAFIAHGIAAIHLDRQGNIKDKIGHHRTFRLDDML